MNNNFYHIVDKSLTKQILTSYEQIFKKDHEQSATQGYDVVPVLTGRMPAAAVKPSGTWNSMACLE
eukprot:1153967-Amphidinium_carterae.1